MWTFIKCWQEHWNTVSRVSKTICNTLHTGKKKEGKNRNNKVEVCSGGSVGEDSRTMGERVKKGSWEGRRQNLSAVERRVGSGGLRPLKMYTVRRIEGFSFGGGSTRTAMIRFNERESWSHLVVLSSAERDHQGIQSTKHREGQIILDFMVIERGGVGGA